MENKTLADLTQEEKRELRNLIDRTPIDDMFLDLFCEMFNNALDYANGCMDRVMGKGVPNEKEN